MDTFKVGDIVRKVAPYWVQGYTSWSSENENKTLQEQIDGQPRDKYDIENRTEYIISEVHYGAYQIMNMKTGDTSAWWHDFQLEFVREGGEDMVAAIAEKGRQHGIMMQTLPWIKTHYPDDLSWGSWNYLLRYIGWDSSFNYNGEYFCLKKDVDNWKTVFDSIAAGNVEGAVAELYKMIRPEYRNRFEDKIVLLCAEWAAA